MRPRLGPERLLDNFTNLLDEKQADALRARLAQGAILSRGEKHSTIETDAVPMLCQLIAFFVVSFA